MTTVLTTQVSMLSVVRGQRQDRVLGGRAVEPKPEISERGNLYLFLELVSEEPAPLRLYRTILDAVQTSYYTSEEEDVSQAVAAALLAGHEALRHANRRAPAPWEGHLGCLVLPLPVGSPLGRPDLPGSEDGELILGRAGSVTAIVTGTDGATQLAAQEPEDAIPLGGDDIPDVDLISMPWAPGDTFFMGSASWEEQVPLEQLASATAAATEVALEDLLDWMAELAGASTVEAILVSVLQVEQVEGVEFQAEPEADYSHSVLNATGSEEPEPLLRSSASPDRIPRAVSSPTTPEPTPPTTATRPASQRGKRLGRSITSLGGVLLAELRRLATNLLPERRSTIPDKLEETPRTRDDTSASAQAQEKTLEQPMHAQRPWAMWLALALLPLAVLIGTGVYLGRGYIIGQEIERLMAAAETHYQTAVASDNQDFARSELRAAQNLLAESRALGAFEQDVAALETRIQDHLYRIDHVILLRDLDIPLVAFDRVGERDPTRVLVSDLHVFILDQGLGQVEYYRLDATRDVLADLQPGSQGEIVMRTGQQVGESVIGPLVDIAWAPTGTLRDRATLLALDAGGNLWAWERDDGVLAIPLGDFGVAQDVRRAAGYAGNFYAFDAGNQEIWRWRPAAGAYWEPPDSWLAPDTEVDFRILADVSIDGHIWVLESDGTIRNLLRGEPADFELRNVPEGMNSPTAIFAGTADGVSTQMLYVADAGHGRLLELSKNGEFRRQFRAPEGDLLHDVRSISVDEIGQALFLLRGDGLYFATLPEMPPLAN